MLEPNFWLLFGLITFVGCILIALGLGNLCQRRLSNRYPPFTDKEISLAPDEEEAGPGWTQDDIDKLELAISQGGPSRVAFSGQTVTFASVGEMLRLRNIMNHQLRG